MTWMTWCAACALVACAHTPPRAPSPRVVARLPERVFDTTADGVRLATLPRGTPGVVRLALYVDAGSRDATAPQTATLAAWLAAAQSQSGPAIEPTLFPDATELALTCSSERLAACVRELARALALRTPDEQALADARARLRDGLRRALAHDPYALLEKSALRALLGDAASGFFPLGDADADLASAGEAVPAFLRDHYGPARTLLVAAGDVEPAALREAASAAFAGAPRAQLTRTPRRLVALEAARLEVSFDTRAAAVLALEDDDRASLRDVIGQLSLTLGQADPPSRVSGYVFAARSGALALLRLEAKDPEAALARAARELARLQVEPSARVHDTMRSDDLIAATRELGLGFASEGVSEVHDFRFAGALALAAGHDAGPAAANQRREAEGARAEKAQALWTQSLAQAHPATHGESDEYVAAVSLDNGAHIDVQFTQGEDVSIAIRVAVGAELDSPLMHGQSAVLATLTSMSCAGMGPQLLQSRVADLGATLEPRVDAESYGLLLRAPKQHFEAALDLGLRCMRAPSRDARDLAEAEVVLQRRLRTPGTRYVMRARAANAVAPRAPGALAPWGDPDRLPNFSARELEQSLAATSFGRNWAVGVVGPVQVQPSVAMIARRLADLGTGAASKTSRWSEPPAVLPAELPHSREAAGAKALAMWTVRGPFDDALGARLYVRAIAAILSAVPGVEVLAHEADAYKETAFAALSLQLKQDVIGLLPSLLQGAARTIDEAWLERALEPAVAEALRTDSLEQAQFSTRAEHIARQRLGASFAQPSVGTASRLLRALRDSRPGFVPLP